MISSRKLKNDLVEIFMDYCEYDSNDTDEIVIRQRQAFKEGVEDVVNILPSEMAKAKYDTIGYMIKRIEDSGYDSISLDVLKMLKEGYRILIDKEIAKLNELRNKKSS